MKRPAIETFTGVEHLNAKLKPCWLVLVSVLEEDGDAELWLGSECKDEGCENIMEDDGNAGVLHKSEDEVFENIVEDNGDQEFSYDEKV